MTASRDFDSTQAAALEFTMRRSKNMRRPVVVLLIVSLLESGCTIAAREFQYPNGYTGYVLDRHTINAAHSKDLQLLRAAIVIAMASRMATATVREGQDADAVAGYLASAASELNYAAAEIYPSSDGTVPCGLPPGADNPGTGKQAGTTGAGVDSGGATTSKSTGNGSQCEAYYANFESDLPMLEARIIRLMLASLPQERSKQFLSDVGKGDVLGAALTAIRTVMQATSGLDRSAGVYRSGLELVASSVTCVKNSPGSFDPQTQTTWDAVECLGLSHDKLGPMSATPVPRGTTYAQREYPLNALLRIAQSSCALLPISNDGAIADAVKQRSDACALVTFNPKPRPVTLSLDSPPVTPAKQPAAATVVKPAVKAAH